MRASPFALVGSFILLASVRADAPLPKVYDLPAIHAHVMQEVRAKGYVGLQLGIMRGGQIVHLQGYGSRVVGADEPVTPRTMFRIGSVTKQFTCAAILLLADEGKLAVTDHVGKYFPGLTKADSITLLDLMHHVSGYPDYYPLDFLDRRMQADITLEQLAQQYAGGPLDFEPGSRYSYSNTGYILLGGVVEKVSGLSLGEFLTRRIFQTLGMAHTRYLDASDLEDRATGHWSFMLGPPEPALAEPPGWLAGAGGIWSTAEDLLKWNLALAEGRVLQPASYELMTNPRRLSDGRHSMYGCGLVLGELAGERTLSHSGAVSGFLAQSTLLPRSRSSVVLLTNGEHVRPNMLYRGILELVARDEVARQAPAVPNVAGPPPRDVILSFWRELQEASVDRSRLSDEFNAFLTDERIKQSAARLKALGEPERVVLGEPGERGGMQVVTASLHFKDKTVKASLYRTPDGIIHQLLFTSE